MGKRILVCALVMIMLCGCGNSAVGNLSEDVPDQEPSHVSGGNMDVEMPDVSSVKADLVYDTVDIEKYVGIYEDGKAQTGLIIYRVTDKYVWFSFHKSNARLTLTRAKRKSGNTYEFTYKYDNKKDDNTFRAGGKKTGEITLLKLAAEVEIQGKTDPCTLAYQGRLQFKEQKKKRQVCDLFKCINEYFSVRTSIYRLDQTYIQIGKERGTDRISYIEVDPENASLYNASLYNWQLYGKEEEKKNYKMGSITFFSTIEECDKEFGEPTKKTESERRYLYNREYEVVISFDGDCIGSMGIYRKSKESALQEYTVGEFTLQGCRIVKYNGSYNGTMLELPEDATGIAKNAFKLEKSKEPTLTNKYNKNQDGTPVRKISMCISKKVYLEPLAFCKSGPLEITFEEGREEIEQGAFYDAGMIERYGTLVTLPESITRIRQRAFEKSAGSAGAVQLVLNKELQRIDSYALYGGAIFGKLPQNLRQLGDYSIYIDCPKEKLEISRTLKKVGFNAISYGNEMKNGGVIVDRHNPYFKSDKKGWMYSKNGKKLYLAFAYQETLRVPEGVETIECELVTGPDDHEKDPDIVFPSTLKKK